MPESAKNHGGTPKGNHNARIHGFYSKQLSKIEQDDLEQASLVPDIDTEIAIVRVQIRNLLVFDPENIRLFCTALTSLCGLLRTRDRLYGTRREELGDVIDRIIEEQFVPAGIIMPREYYTEHGIAPPPGYYDEPPNVPDSER